MPRLPALFALSFMLGACAVPTSVGLRIGDGDTVTLVPGQAASLADGSSLRYVRLVNDSRCPPDVQCVWAGNAELALSWSPTRGATRNLQLHTNSSAGLNHADLDGRRVTLDALSLKGAQARLRVTLLP